MADDTPPTKSLEVAPAKRNIPYERTFAETFDVLVGREHNQQPFTVHHDITTRRSKFFRQARSPQWNSDKSVPVELQHADPQIFDLYLHFVYHDAAPSFIGDTSTEAELRYEVFIDLYVLADSLRDSATAELAIGEIFWIRDREKLPEAGTIHHAYRHTMKGCALRGALVEIYAEATWLPDGDFPNAFLRSVVERQMYLQLLRHGD